MSKIRLDQYYSTEENLNMDGNTAANMEFDEMPASEQILSDISLVSFSSICRIADELWNIKSALYLYSTPGQQK
jgi:hypothetical protein